MILKILTTASATPQQDFQKTHSDIEVKVNTPSAFYS